MGTPRERSQPGSDERGKNKGKRSNEQGDYRQEDIVNKEARGAIATSPADWKRSRETRGGEEQAGLAA